jgi:hypothetical protein
LKKRSKKLLLNAGCGNRGANAPGKSKFFAAARGGLLFVHKEKCLLALWFD